MSEAEPAQPDSELDDDPALQRLAGAILDGTPVDWQAAASGTPAALIDELKLLAELVGVQRTLRSPAEHPGTAIGEWGSLTLLERIGEGGFGEVFRAWDRRLDREVALKLLHPSAHTVDAHLSATIEEGRLLARVRHPNVVSVFGAERIDGRVGLWMEFVHGHTLTDWMREHGPFSAEEATSIGIELCLALAAVHDAGLLHRDIKPQNVMRGHDGRVVLMDFGAGIDQSQPALVGARELAGTPIYLAPELLNGGSATRQSDLYSVGVLLSFLVTGTYPVTGATLAELRDAHGAGRLQRLRETRPGLPHSFVQIVERALSPEPGARFESARALEEALSRAQQPQARRSRRFMALTAATLLLAAATITAALLRNRTDSGALRLEQVWTGAEVNLEGRVSPDGRLMTFNDWTNRDGDLAVRDLTTGQNRLLTREAASTSYAAESLISPDGRHVAFTWWDGDQSSTRVMGLDGTDLRVIAHSNRTEDVLGAWSPDGKYIALTRFDSDDESHRVLLLSAATGSIVHSKSTRGRAPSLGAFSPDGRYLLYALPPDPESGAGGVFALASDFSRELTIVSDSANNTRPIWSPDGERVFYVSDKAGATALWSVGFAGRGTASSPQIVRPNVGDVAFMNSADDGTLHYGVQDVALDVYVAEFDPATRTARSMKLLVDRVVGSNFGGAISPDGRYVAFLRRAPNTVDYGAAAVWVKALPSGDERQIAQVERVGFADRVVQWFPDSRSLLLQMDQQGRRVFQRIDVETGDIRTAFEGSLAIGRATALSRDGATLTYAVVDEIATSGQRVARLVRRVLKTGDEAELFRQAADGINQLAISPDGTALAFSVRGPGRKPALSTVQTTGGVAREVSGPGFAGLSAQGALTWTSDHRHVIGASSCGGVQQLCAIPIDGGEPTPLGLGPLRIRTATMTHDGRRIVFTAHEPRRELWRIRNLLTRQP